MDDNKEKEEYKILKDLNNRLENFNKENQEEKDDDDGR